MTTIIRTYRADPELSKLLERAARGELRLRIDTDDDVYEIHVSDMSAEMRREMSREQFDRREGIWKDYDVGKARAALENARGVLEGVDVEALVQRIRDDRSDDPIDLSS